MFFPAKCCTSKLQAGSELGKVSKEQDSSWQRHSSKVGPLGDPQCSIFGSNILSSYPCASYADIIYIILLMGGNFAMEIHISPH